MLSVIIVCTPEVRDAFVSALSLEKQNTPSDGYSLYQRGKWILLFHQSKNLQGVIAWAVENYMPERIYLPFFGRSIDMVHEIGDIIMPNVLLSYDINLDSTEITKENRDTFSSGVKFLEIYDEQKDYYVEDYGLSIGGIVVDMVPENADAEKLMLAYEADVYLSDGASSAYEIIQNYELPIVIATGVVDGKNPKNRTLSPLDHTVRNMVVTFRLLEGE